MKTHSKEVVLDDTDSDNASNDAGYDSVPVDTRTYSECSDEGTDIIECDADDCAEDKFEKEVKKYVHLVRTQQYEEAEESYDYYISEYVYAYVSHLIQINQSAAVKPLLWALILISRRHRCKDTHCNISTKCWH